MNGPVPGLLRGLVLSIVLASSGLPTAAAAGPVEEPWAFGTYIETLRGDLAGPTGVACTADGRILIADADEDVVRIIDRRGQSIGTIGTSGWNHGQLIAPHDVAVLDSGEIVVADTGNQRVQIFTADGGGLVRTIGGPYDVGPDFVRPTGVATSGDRIIVADAGADRVFVVDRQGRTLLTIGGRGTERGRFRMPYDVVTDDDGRIHVADRDNHRIQVFEADGSLRTAWGEWGGFPGLLRAPGMLAWHAGHLFVADSLNHRIQVFDATGRAVHEWGLHAGQPREGEGRLHLPTGIAVAPDGSFAVVAEPFERRCQIFEWIDEAGRMTSIRLRQAIGLESSDFGTNIAAGTTFLAVDVPESGSVNIYDERREVPIHITTLGEPGRGIGLVGRIASLGFSADDDLSLGDAANDRLATYRMTLDADAPPRFDPFMSRFVKSVDLPRALELSGRGTSADGLEIVGAVRDAEGRQYVLDRRRARVVVLDAGGTSIGAWGERGLHSGHFRDPRAIAMSVDRRTIFIADAWHPMVSAYTLDGRHLWTWGGAGSDRSLRRPCAIAAGRDGRVYVADSAADTVFVLSEDGAYVRRFGDTGVDNGQFWSPSGVAQAASGRLYVLDYGNHRVQGFDADGRWLVTFGVSRSVTRAQLEQMGRPVP